MLTDSELLLLACSTIITTVAGVVAINSRKSKQKKKWCRSWLKRRNKGKGILNLLDDELRTEDSWAYTNFLRLTSVQFEYLHGLICNDIKKEDTQMREAISTRNK